MKCFHYAGIFLVAFVPFQSSSQQQATTCLNNVVFEDAVTSAVSVPNEGGEEILDEIALYAANLRDFSAALRVASKIKDDRGLHAHEMLDHLLHQLAIAQAQSGDFAGARATTYKIHTRYPNVLVEIAALQAEKGDLEGALKSVRH